MFYASLFPFFAVEGLAFLVADPVVSLASCSIVISKAFSTLATIPLSKAVKEAISTTP